jgi:hypothetical protein
MLMLMLFVVPPVVDACICTYPGEICPTTFPCTPQTQTCTTTCYQTPKYSYNNGTIVNNNLPSQIYTNATLRSDLGHTNGIGWAAGIQYYFYSGWCLNCDKPSWSDAVPLVQKYTVQQITSLPANSYYCLETEGLSLTNRIWNSNLNTCIACIKNGGVVDEVGFWTMISASPQDCGINLPPPNEFQQTNLDAWNTALEALSATWPAGIAAPQATVDSLTGQLVITGSYVTGSNQALTATGTISQPPFTVPVGLTCPQDFKINWRTSRCETTLSCVDNDLYMLTNTNAEPACILPADQAPQIQVQPVADITPLGSCQVGTVTIISSQETCGSLSGTFTPLGGGLPLSDLGSLVKIGWCVTGSGSGLALESSCVALDGTFYGAGYASSEMTADLTVEIGTCSNSQQIFRQACESGENSLYRMCPDVSVVKRVNKNQHDPLARHYIG